PGERRGRSDRRDPPGSDEPVALRLRDRYLEHDRGADGGAGPCDPPREARRPRARVGRLERRGAVLVLDRYRILADRFLVPVARRMIRVNPNAVSWAGFLAAVGAGNPAHDTAFGLTRII